MPKKTKTANKNAQQTPGNGTTDPQGVVAKPSRRSSAKPRKPAAKKTAKGNSTKTVASPVLGAQPTDEEIRLRAYFIAERRHRLALPGDADSDWLEAKRQLHSEAGPK